MKHHALVLRLACALWLLAGPLFGQGVVKLTGITTPGSYITLTLQNTASLPPTGLASGFRLEGSPAMSAGTWGFVAATFAPVSGQPGFFSTTIPRPPVVSSYFYRIIGIAGTATDLDGDGLPNAFEQTGGYSDPATFDTDGDGFDDGLEFAFGTDPRDASSHPSTASEPAIEFVLAQSSVTEGTPTHTLTLVADRPFTGSVSVAYSVKTRSSAKSPADYTIVGSTTAPVATPQEDDRRGTITFNGTSATLDIQINDDLVISQERLLMVQIEPSTVSPSPYRTGARITHVVRISDNDAYWNGVLRDALTERNFRLRILNNGGSPQIAFVAGTKDGLPLFDGGLTSQSNGVVPVKDAGGATHEEWPATLIANTPTTFTFASPVMPAEAGGLLGAGVSLTRTLTLDAIYEVTLRRIAGTFAEVLNPATAGQTWLSSQRSGAFVLIRDIPQIATSPNPLRP